MSKRTLVSATMHALTVEERLHRVFERCQLLADVWELQAAVPDYVRAGWSDRDLGSVVWTTASGLAPMPHGL